MNDGTHRTGLLFFDRHHIYLAEWRSHARPFAGAYTFAHIHIKSSEAERTVEGELVNYNVNVGPSIRCDQKNASSDGVA